MGAQALTSGQAQLQGLVGCGRGFPHSLSGPVGPSPAALFGSPAVAREMCLRGTQAHV